VRFNLTRALPTLLVLAIGLAGCVPAVSVRPPASADLDKVKDGQLAVAFFQVKTIIDGKALSPLEANSNSSLRIYLANLSEHTAPKPVSATMPSEAAAVEGWRYLLLPPGTYYLLVLPPGVEQNPPAVAFHAPSAKYGRLTQYKFEPGRGGFWSPELMGFVFPGTPPPDFRELPGFWFEVPKEKPVVYLGTLSTACTTGHGLFGDLIGFCSDYDMMLDSKAAQRVAAATLPGLGAVHTEPLALYGKTRDGIPLRERGSINVVTLASATLDAAFTGAQMAPSGVIYGSTPAVGIFNLLTIAGEAANRASAQQEAEQHAAEAKPCMVRLAKTLPAIDYASQFTAALAQAAHSRGTVLDLNIERELTTTGRSTRLRQKLTIAAPILHLRESGLPQYLALELGLQVRLETSVTKSVVYDSLLLYAEGFTRQNPLEQRSRLYERLLPQRAQPRPMSEWCGTNGAALLKKEIGIGLQYIAAQLARDLE